jgi:hypothetical protein
LRFHPDSQFTVVLLDDEVGEIDSGDGSFTILRIEEVAFEPDQLEQMFLIYDVMELATAVKPWVFRHLLAAGAEEVLYFDPDIQIFARLDDLAALARRHAVVLTPHSTEPFPRDRKRVTEADILGSGVYNLGFLALSNDSRRFLDWWAERLLRDCISDPQRMMFTDQRWIDFVPGFFPHTILRDTTVNVAYWNLHARRLTGAHGSYTVDGKPLRFFHFSGFDPDVPYVLSKHMTDRPVSSSVKTPLWLPSAPSTAISSSSLGIGSGESNSTAGTLFLVVSRWTGECVDCIEPLWWSPSSKVKRPSQPIRRRDGGIYCMVEPAHHPAPGTSHLALRSGPVR